MDGTEVEPGEPGRGVPVPQQRAGTAESRKHSLTGPQGTLEANIKKTLDRRDGTLKVRQRQAYPVRWLRQRYGLSQNLAFLLAAEFRWGDA
jgi:hypothetical protein